MSWTGKPGPEWAEYDKLVAEDKRAAAAKIAEARLAKLEGSDKSEEWTRALLRLATLRFDDHDSLQGLRLLHERPWPRDLLGFTATSLVYAGLLERTLLTRAFELDRNSAETSTSAGIETWGLADFRAEIGRVYQGLWDQRARLGEVKQAALAEYLEANDYPPQVRPTLRDAVTYLYVESLASDWFARFGSQDDVGELDLEQLIGRKPMAAASLADSRVPRIVAVAYVLDDLETYHRGRGESEAAFEARKTQLERVHALPFTVAQLGRVRAQLHEELATVAGKSWSAMGLASLADLTMESDEPDRFIRARELARQGEKAFPKSPGGERCRQIRETIEQPELTLEAMAADAAKRRSIGVHYKNLDKLYFRAFPLDVEQRLEAGKDATQLSELELFLWLSTQHPRHAWSIDLAPTRDHVEHQAFVVPPMERPGFYLVVASMREDFARSGNRLAAVVTSISALALVVNRAGDLFRVDAFSAETGEPLADVEVLAYGAERGGGPLARARTNALGTATVPVTGKAGERSFWARKGSDRALAEAYSYFAERERPELEALVYTDRSVYRPGQSVRLKVVAYRRRGAVGRLQVAPHAQIKLTLRDAFHEKVAEKTLVAGARGSATCELTLPTGRPLGRWSIESSPAGAAWISVEEYQRSSFAARLLEPATPARLGHATVVKGEARYYFGEPVVGGKVRWRLTRTVSPPAGWWKKAEPRDWRRFHGLQAMRSVSTGVSSTDAGGKFEIGFLPKADGVLAELGPGTRFAYAIEVDVTDQGGETNHAERTFHVGTVAVTAEVTAEAQFLRAGQTGQIAVSRKTLDGAPAPGSAKWRIVQITQPTTARMPADEPRAMQKDNPYALPDDKVRPRWEANPVGERSVLSGFPDGVEQASGQLVHDDKGEAVVPVPALPAGAWRLAYSTTDAFGGKHELTHDFIVAGARTPLALAAYLHVEKPTVKVGDRAHVLVGSGLPDQIVVLDRLRGAKLVERTVLRTDHDPSLIEIPIGELDRGGLSLALTVIRDHQRIHLSRSISVPWDNKELKVEFARFREVMRPGAEETLSVKVTGPAGKPTAIAAAEVLAYMYDRSLDALTEHRLPSPLAAFPGESAAESTDTSLGVAPRLWLGRLGGASEPSPVGPPHGDRVKVSPGGLLLRRSANIGKAKVIEDADKDPAPAMLKRSGGRQALYAPAPMDAQAGLRAFGSVADGETDEAPAPSRLRSDFSETAFFVPQLLTGRDGTATFQFRVPDAATGWTAWAHAITPDLKSGSASLHARTVKDLLVRSYLPRFLREGDRAVLDVVVNNASTRDLSGSVSLDLIDAESGKSLLSAFGLGGAEVGKRAFSVKARGSTAVSYVVTTPARLGPVAVRVTARSGEFSDGELRPLPILPGRMHVSQSRRAVLKDASKRTLVFDPPGRQGDPTWASERLVITVEAQLLHALVAALPYLVNYPHACTEQTLNRFLSTGIMATLYRREPGIARLAKQMGNRQTELAAWDSTDANRAMALEETPWLGVARGGASEANLTSVLEPRAIEATRAAALAKLREAQLPSGAFPWFAGGPPSTAMTLYLLEGFARATEFGVEVPKPLVASAARYLHSAYADEGGFETATVLGYILSRFGDPSWYGSAFTLAERQAMLTRAFEHWRELSPHLKGLLALTLARMERAADARLVWASVLDRARSEPDLGTFWPAEAQGWLWYHDPIESQAAAIRTTLELDPGSDKLDGMVEWLLLNKLTSHWKSTRATADAIYALASYLRAKGSLGNKQEVVVALGDWRHAFDFVPGRYRPGRSQVVVPNPDPSAATVVVEQRSRGMAFTSATWHYAIDQLPQRDTGDLIGVSREYLRVDKSGVDVKLVPLGDGDNVEIGDELEVRLRVRARVAVDYVHVRDPRAAGCEPARRLSGHARQGDLRYYEEVRDSGTNFFVERLPPGEHVLSHRLRASMAGTFRTAPATAQPMYTPEHTATSAGHTVVIAGGKSTERP